MIKWLGILLISYQCHAGMNPMNVPDWSDQEKYSLKSPELVPHQKSYYIATGALSVGLKNGYGLDLIFTRKLNRYLLGGARLFTGFLNSEGLVRPPTDTELNYSTTPQSSEYYSILANPAQWFSFIPELGFGLDRMLFNFESKGFYETFWFGIGKPLIGGRWGTQITLEPGINYLFKNEHLGMTARIRYSFGWLNPKSDEYGTIPYDWFSLTTGIFYEW